MSDYVKREDAINTVCNYCDRILTGDLFTPCEPNDCGLLRDLKLISAADVVERKRGKWIPSKEPPWLDCSECGQDSVEYTNYCPNCGADMRGDDDD